MAVVFSARLPAAKPSTYICWKPAPPTSIDSFKCGNRNDRFEAGCRAHIRIPRREFRTRPAFLLRIPLGDEQHFRSRGSDTRIAPGSVQPVR